ncbi:hypothetical protein H632_c3807p0, partial [Helicosporidium sp. ATCC 50920]
MRGHALPVSLVAWSPGDRYVASCSQDCTARLWDAREGTCARVLRHHAQSVTCLAFCPALAGLVTGSHDRSLALLGLQGGLRRRWSAGRMQEVVVAKRFFALCASGERSVAVVDLRSEGDAPEGDSEDRFLLLSLASAAIRLYDLGPDPEVLSLPRAPAALFLPPAPAPGRFVVRACLGGIDERFVLS